MRTFIQKSTRPRMNTLPSPFSSPAPRSSPTKISRTCKQERGGAERQGQLVSSTPMPQLDSDGYVRTVCFLLSTFSNARARNP